MKVNAEELAASGSAAWNTRSWSLVTGRVRRIDFDIDLAVDSDRYFRIVDWSLRQPFPIDVVDLQSIDEGFAEEVERHGRILYETKR